jgi:DMSO/TMAO reductase YedYZ molybdopterin-dependent catalytic subunit
VIAPTPPAETPGYIELDPDTGLHMTGTAQQIDLESYRLEVSGKKVDHPLSLTYDDLRCLPKVEARATLTCPGFFSDEATWAGAPIREVLALAAVQEGAATLKMISADGFATSIPISEVYETGFLAYEWEGEPLPILHGFPVRIVLPGVTGGYWVKWLIALEVN